MTLKTFLKKDHAAATVKIYLFEINHFIVYLGKEKASEAKYKDIINYVHFLRKQYQNPRTVSHHKQYYFF